MGHSYCQQRGLMSECTIHVHRQVDANLRYSTCRFYEPRSESDDRCLHVRKDINYHCDSLEAQKDARADDVSAGSHAV